MHQRAEYGSSEIENTGNTRPRFVDKRNCTPFVSDISTSSDAWNDGLRIIRENAKEEESNRAQLLEESHNRNHCHVTWLDMLYAIRLQNVASGTALRNQSLGSGYWGPAIHMRLYA